MVGGRESFASHFILVSSKLVKNKHSERQRRLEVALQVLVLDLMSSVMVLTFGMGDGRVFKMGKRP